MVTQELMNAVMQERQAEVARLHRELEALKVEGRAVSPRSGPSRLRFRWLTLPFFVAQRLRAVLLS